MAHMTNGHELRLVKFIYRLLPPAYNRARAWFCHSHPTHAHTQLDTTQLRP